MIKFSSIVEIIRYKTTYFALYKCKNMWLSILIDYNIYIYIYPKIYFVILCMSGQYIKSVILEWTNYNHDHVTIFDGQPLLIVSI